MMHQKERTCRSLVWEINKEKIGMMYVRSQTTRNEDLRTLDEDEIEALIRRGRLSQFVGEKKQAEPHDNAPDKHPRATKDINVISGGASLARDSNKARKEYARRTPSGLETLSIGPGYWTPKSPKLGYSAITFNEEEEKGVVHPHDDPFIIQAEITNYCVKWVFIDTGSSVNIIFTSAFEQMEISLEEHKPVVTPLLGFTRDNINSIGSITLPLSASLMLSPSLHRQPHALDEIRTKTGVGYVKGDQQKARECYIKASKQRMKEKMEMYVVERDGIDREVELNPREGTNKQQAIPGEDLEEVQIDGNHPDRIVKIGAQLPPQIRDDLTNFLLENAKVFAWSYEDMPGIDPKIISHCLSIDPVFKPIRQKCRA
ncbi:hypothetical protein L3X38_011597 [Prunus dulcis]|uniref:Uncharacterized protein n=1 Tax=Prunus dulcis TaxID=3755 RepID=A0AAD4WIE9_PRUDU|nr:hypothetical protein L3X38_011597 [Prunus dulcis]